MFSGKKILVGITGAIAAYKILELIRMYKKNGAEVNVVVTPNALEFVTKTTLQTLSQNQVYIDQFNPEEYCPEHISLADWADIFVIAPVSANTLGKIAKGLCDNLLTSIACAYRGPILLAPSMNTGMWDNVAVQENISFLISKGCEVVEPEVGYLACGYNGKGRLASLDSIFDRTKELLFPSTVLSGKKILITAGGTRENIDPVRYIGNYSSGKMGLALADVAFKMGAEVELIATFEVVRPYKTIKVDSASQMMDEVQQRFKHSDSVIMAAAVSDYRVKNKFDNKIKKDNEDSLTLELLKNPDILHFISSEKKENQVIVGFCAESENLLENAKIKIEKKKCDFIVANDISDTNIGFSSDYNEVYLIDSSKNVVKIPKNTKQNIAKKIIEEIYG